MCVFFNSLVLLLSKAFSLNVLCFKSQKFCFILNPSAKGFKFYYSGNGFYFDLKPNPISSTSLCFRLFFYEKKVIEEDFKYAREYVFFSSSEIHLYKCGVNEKQRVDIGYNTRHSKDNKYEIRKKRAKEKNLNIKYLYV